MKGALITNLELPDKRGVGEHRVTTWSSVCSVGPLGGGSDPRPSHSHSQVGSYLVGRGLRRAGKQGQPSPAFPGTHGQGTGSTVAGGGERLQVREGTFQS